MLAAVWAMRTLRYYLHGTAFTLITDHKPLEFLRRRGSLSLRPGEVSSKHMRWWSIVQDFDFEIEHRPGVEHVVPDVLSRHARAYRGDFSGARLDYDPLPPVRTSPAPPSTTRRTTHGGLPAETVNPARCLATCGRRTPHSWRTWQHLPAGVLVHQGGVTHLSSWRGVDAMAAPASGDDAECHGGAGSSFSEDRARPRGPSYARSVARRAAHQAQARYGADAASLRGGGQRHPVHNPQVPQAFQAPQVQAPQVPQALQAPQVQISSLVGRAADPRRWHQRAVKHGITLVDVCGGIGTALEATLQSGIPVQHYVYADSNTAAQQVAHARAKALQEEFPHLLAADALATSPYTIPQDVRLWTAELALHIHEHAATNNSPILVVAGWPCQDLSAAGLQRGLDGDRSSLIGPISRWVAALLDHNNSSRLAHLNHAAPVAYLLENVAFQHNWKSKTISKEQFDTITEALGPPVTFDAAACGSAAHRTRNFWSSLGCPMVTQAAFDLLHQQAAQAAPLTSLADILDVAHEAPIAASSDKHPQVLCNQQGKPVRCLPTLMSFPGSRAFRPGRNGCLRNIETGAWEEPTAEERERCMGLATGVTALPGYTQRQRCEMLGASIDLNALVALQTVYAELARAEPAQVSHARLTKVAEGNRGHPAPTSPHVALRPMGPVASLRSTYGNMAVNYLQHQGHKMCHALGTSAATLQAPVAYVCAERPQGACDHCAKPCLWCMKAGKQFSPGLGHSGACA